MFEKFWSFENFILLVNDKGFSKVKVYYLQRVPEYEYAEMVNEKNIKMKIILLHMKACIVKWI